jgi:hypothetical protein
MHPIFTKFERGMRNMIKKHIKYKRKEVYALYYRSTETIYYNLDFVGKIQLILLF